MKIYTVWLKVLKSFVFQKHLQQKQQEAKKKKSRTAIINGSICFMRSSMVAVHCLPMTVKFFSKTSDKM